MASDQISTEPRNVGFLLIPGFAIISYAAAMEPLRAANVLSGRQLYRWTHISPHGEFVDASNGIRILCDSSIDAEPDLDLLLVCAGGNPALFREPATFSWLRAQARRGVRIGGVAGGPYILARAGLLDNHRCTIHWEHIPAFAEEFPQIELSRSLYEIAGNRPTCAGGIAALDMMHALIALDHGKELAAAVSEWFLQTHVRPSTGPQRMSIRERFGIPNAKLIRVIEHMQENLEAPLSRETLADFVGVSVRQIERLFRTYLDTGFSEFYLTLRLERAKQLVHQTGMPLVEIALACGFKSASHFARAYARHWGKPPSSERRGASLAEGANARDLPYSEGELSDLL